VTLKEILYNRAVAYLNLGQREKTLADLQEAYKKGDDDALKLYESLTK
jgi:hypothetical protein